MAFTSAVTDTTIIGNMRKTYGTYANADDTTNGGTITTQLSTVRAFGTVPTTNVDELMPKYSVSGGTVTLVTAYGSGGNWWAEGYGGG